MSVGLTSGHYNITKQKPALGVHSSLALAEHTPKQHEEEGRGDSIKRLRFSHISTSFMAASLSPTSTKLFKKGRLIRDHSVGFHRSWAHLGALQCKPKSITRQRLFHYEVEVYLHFHILYASLTVPCPQSIFKTEGLYKERKCYFAIIMSIQS